MRRVILADNQDISKAGLLYFLNLSKEASEIEEAMFRIPSGSISLDIALGGGIPGGVMTHICGDYSAGKSALAYHIIANAQKLKKKKVHHLFMAPEKIHLQGVLSLCLPLPMLLVNCKRRKRK